MPTPLGTWVFRATLRKKTKIAETPPAQADPAPTHRPTHNTYIDYNTRPKEAEWVDTESVSRFCLLVWCRKRWRHASSGVWVKAGPEGGDKVFPWTRHPEHLMGASGGPHSTPAPPTSLGC